MSNKPPWAVAPYVHDFSGRPELPLGFQHGPGPAGEAGSVEIFPKRGYVFGTGLRTWSAPGEYEISALYVGQLDNSLVLRTCDAAAFNLDLPFEDSVRTEALEVLDGLLEAYAEAGRDPSRIAALKARLEFMSPSASSVIPASAVRRPEPWGGGVPFAFVALDMGCLSRDMPMVLQFRRLKEGAELRGAAVGYREDRPWGGPSADDVLAFIRSDSPVEPESDEGNTDG